MANVGKKIYERRTQLGMSQEDLAKKVGYKDRSSIAKIESGERDIRQRKVVDFANALQTTPQVLMGYEEIEKALQTPQAEHGMPIGDIQLNPYLKRVKLLNSGEWIDILEQMNDEQLQELHKYAKYLLHEK